MRTFLYTHAACFGHDPGRTHPEHPARLKAVLTSLESPDFNDLTRMEAPEASREDLIRVHDAAYVEQVFAAVPAAGLRPLDSDTMLSPGSGSAALRAAGALVAAADAVMAEQCDNAFCAVRPPGHHAEPGHAMGFCLFNNIGVAAYHLREKHGIRRIAIVDFDVHHGNGSQTLAARDPDLFYASTHQWPLYPGTGLPNERGPAQNILNVPLTPMAGSAQFRAAYTDQILPALHDFAPDFLLVSAGFDGHEDDPLASLRLHEDDYAWVTKELVRLAVWHCGGRLVSALEGGYELHALGRSAAAHVQALMQGT